MTRIILLLLCAALLQTCRPISDQFYMPAEWEPHEAVWLGWESDTASGFYPSIAQMIQAMKPNVTVKLAFDSDSLKQTAITRMRQLGVDTGGLRYYVMPGERYWIRDHGAAFLVNEKGQLGVADFGWNTYGYPGYLELYYNGNKDSVQKRMAKFEKSQSATGSVDSLMAVAEGATRLSTTVIHEGGAIEVNGKGTLILCEATVLQRNPGWSKEKLEAEFKRVLGVRHIIWLKQGLADDPHFFYRRITGNYVGGGTGGHTDEFVRFANANTILLSWVDEAEKDLNPINRMNYERMSDNYQVLAAAKDQDGKSFTIIKVPLPDLKAEQVVALAKESDQPTLDVPVDRFIPAERPKVGDTLLRVPAASYLNYLVTNGLVLLPTYLKHGTSAAKEAAVRKIFEEQFPGRKVLFFDFINQNWQGGGLHCSTQQQPGRG